MRVFSSVLLVALLLCRVALADGEPAAKLPSNAHGEEALRAFNLGEFRRAEREFKQAYRETAFAPFLYSIAQACRFNGDNAQALWYLHAFLRTKPQDSQRARAEQLVAKLEAQGVVAVPPPREEDAAPSVKEDRSDALVVSQSAPPKKSHRALMWGLIGGGALVVVTTAIVLGVTLGSSEHDPVGSRMPITGP